MKISYLKLINYIGIYNGLGLNQIEIDFTKSINKTVIIRGKNASGKSTLFNAMHPMFDSNNNFIPNLEAHKYIHIVHENILYKIHFVHPVKNNGERDTTKAYMKKYYNDEIEDLNPNGNVSSFKDSLYNEFSLDPNYIALSSLGSEDRGLSDKKPADRKKFVNSIIDQLVVYNDIYKTLTKRSSVFKSIMNTLVSKIDNIGDEEKIKSSLISIENRLNKLIEEKEKGLERLSSFKSTIQLIDPDGNIQNIYNQIYTEIIDCNNAYNNTMDNISKINKSLTRDSELVDYESTIKEYNVLKENFNTLSTNIQINESNISFILKDRETLASELSTKQEKLNSLTNDINLNELKAAIENCKTDIIKYKEIIDSMGLYDNNISKDEYLLALYTLKDIKNIIDIFKSNMERSIIEMSIDCIKNNQYPDIDKIDSEIDNIRLKMKESELEYQRYSLLKEVSDKLSMRPVKCTIDTCPFIKDSLNAFNLKPNENMDIINENIRYYELQLNDKIKEKQINKEVSECINYLNNILRSIDNNKMVLLKLNIGQKLFDKNNIFNLILDGYNFTEINEVYKYIEYSNIIDEYKYKIELWTSLNAEYNLYNSKNDIIQELNNDISNITNKIHSIENNINNIRELIQSDKLELDKQKLIIEYYDKLISLLNTKQTIDSKKSELVSKFNSIKSSITSIKECMNGIQDYNNIINKLNSEINPLIEDRDKLKYGLSLLKEYRADLEMYTLKYEKIETIKRYSSPSKGIQTVFMKLYMNKIINMANDLLSLLFEGEYVLCPFIINENEFRIPCIGSGLQNDDISSTSCSQKAMMGLAINAALLCQSSSKYNILKLDELDSGLDTNNRLQFMYILERISNMLNIEQTILISHNSEIDLSNCDIIQLKKNDGDIINEGNLIYEY